MRTETFYYYVKAEKGSRYNLEPWRGLPHGGSPDAKNLISVQLK